MKWSAWVITIILGLAGGCAEIHQMQQERLAEIQKEMDRGYYGTYPKNYQEIIKNFEELRLQDPYSAKYYFSEPPKKACLLGAFRVMKFGYYVEVPINAKNEYGAYSGAYKHSYLILDGEVTMQNFHQYIRGSSTQEPTYDAYFLHCEGIVPK